MKLRLKLTGNTAALADNPHTEAVAILQRCLDAVRATEGSQSPVVIEVLRDSNGNEIGNFRFDPVARPKHERKEKQEV